MKHLLIQYTTESGIKITLFDAEVAEVVWSDSTAGVRVEGKTQQQTGGMNLLDLLTGGGKARTEEVAEDKKAELPAEKAPRKTASRKSTPTVVEADPLEVIQSAQA